MKCVERPPIVKALEALHAHRAGRPYDHTRAKLIDHGERAGLWCAICPCCGDLVNVGVLDGVEVIACLKGCTSGDVRAQMVEEARVMAK